MRIGELVNGVLVYRDMTPEEEAEMRQPDQNPDAHMDNERIGELEGAMVVLLGGDTE